MNQISLVLITAVVTGAVSISGIWLGSRLTRQNESQKWRRDRCLEAYSELVRVVELVRHESDICYLAKECGTEEHTKQAEIVFLKMAEMNRIATGPIKLIKSREDDTANGVYHPITQCKLVGAFDADNNLTGLHMRISGQSILAAVAPARLAEGGRDPITFQGLNPGGTEGVLGYTIPNLLIDHAMVNPPIPPWFWRGVNNNQNAIYLECFMDELAHAAGQDPLGFRRKLMAKHPKHLAVLNAVAEKVGWGQPAPQGVYRPPAATLD